MFSLPQEQEVTSRVVIRFRACREGAYRFALQRRTGRAAVPKPATLLPENLKVFFPALAVNTVIALITTRHVVETRLDLYTV